MQDYAANGFYVVIDWPSNSTDQIKSYLQNPPSPYNEVVPLDLFHCYAGMPYGSYWDDYGIEGYIPYTVLIDMDGNVRLGHTGNLTDNAEWERVIEQLTLSGDYS